MKWIRTSYCSYAKDLSTGSELTQTRLAISFDCETGSHTRRCGGIIPRLVADASNC